MIAQAIKYNMETIASRDAQSKSKQPSFLRRYVTMFPRISNLLISFPQMVARQQQRRITMHKVELIALSLVVAACLILLCQASARIDPCMVELRMDGDRAGYVIEESLVGRMITIRVHLGKPPPDDGMPPDPVSPLEPETKYIVEFSIQVGRESVAVRETLETDERGAGHTTLTLEIPKDTISPARGKVISVAVPPDPCRDPIVSEDFEVVWGER